MGAKGVPCGMKSHLAIPRPKKTPSSVQLAPVVMLAAVMAAVSYLGCGSHDELLTTTSEEELQGWGSGSGSGGGFKDAAQDARETGIADTGSGSVDSGADAGDDSGDTGTAVNTCNLNCRTSADCIPCGGVCITGHGSNFCDNSGTGTRFDAGGGGGACVYDSDCGLCSICVHPQGMPSYCAAVTSGPGCGP
jgi:hypothetical protein